MRVHVVDPSAYTPPYDHALCSALAARGRRRELFTSRFAYGAVPEPRGYERRESFYRVAARVGRPGLRRAIKLAEHVPDMLRLPARGPLGGARPLPVAGAAAARRPAAAPRAAAGADRPRHPPARAPARAARRPAAPVPALRRGRRALPARRRGGSSRSWGSTPARVHVIPHGVFEHLADAPAAEPRRARSRRAAVDAGTAGAAECAAPVVLCFGLMRPYKGIDLLLDAWRRASTVRSCGSWGCRGWTPPRCAPARPRACASSRASSATTSCRPCSRAPSSSCSPTARSTSGVLFTALAFGRPLLLSDVGALPGELAATGAARAVPRRRPRGAARVAAGAARRRGRSASG